jgi:predicted nucleic acid-binding protein
MELLQGVRNKNEMLSMKRFLSTLGFSVLPVTANISSRVVGIMESTALRSDLGVCDSLIFATALDTGDTLLSGNAKHLKEVPLLDARVFRA